MMKPINKSFYSYFMKADSWIEDLKDESSDSILYVRMDVYNYMFYNMNQRFDGYPFLDSINMNQRNNGKETALMLSRIYDRLVDNDRHGSIELIREFQEYVENKMGIPHPNNNDSYQIGSIHSAKNRYLDWIKK